ncbi:MAG: hypothetical protein AB7K09_03165 [Planctomycetota bacterium]
MLIALFALLPAISIRAFGGFIGSGGDTDAIRLAPYEALSDDPGSRAEPGAAVPPPQPGITDSIAAARQASDTEDKRDVMVITPLRASRGTSPTTRGPAMRTNEFHFPRAPLKAGPFAADMWV